MIDTFFLGIIIGAFTPMLVQKVFKTVTRIIAIRRALQAEGAYNKPRRYYMNQIGEWRDD